MDKFFEKGQVVNGYSILEVIGQGRYGIAYLAANDKGEKCVVKQLKNDMLEQTRKKLFYEEKILKQLNDSSFPKFLGKFKDEYREGYILEYIEGKTFHQMLDYDGVVFTKEEIYSIAEEIIAIYEKLHNLNIVHRDIRTPNVILRENNKVALIDFGLARFKDDKKYDEKLDYWFLGDFLIHLYYSLIYEFSIEEKPWYEELDLNCEEKEFLKKLMGLEKEYNSIEEIKIQLKKIRNYK